jgi:hypothetical protein
MQPIEIIVIVISIVFVLSIISWRIVKRIKAKGKPVCCEECAKINYKKIASKANKKKNQVNK